ncbi:Crp/Fnr family transcriptional regulator [Variovorax sp. VaC1]|uniref:Crp/Fnr family transcriptional regulator n=1 Tax=Variovorax sp. VaC1 TaxID=3373132 RepID=UPI003749BD6B
MNHKELIESTLREMPCFAEWAPVAMSQLVAASTLCWHERGSLLSANVQAGEPTIFVIVSGHVVHVETSSESVRLSWALRGPGHILGISYMLDLGGRILEYIANDEVVAIHMPGHLLFGFLDKAPLHWKHMARMVLQQERTQIDLVIGQIVGSLAQRLASVVAQLAALYGVRAIEKDAIRIRLSQQSLADILQVSRQSVNKQLSAWAALGVVRIQYNEIVILDAPALQRMSRPSAPLNDAVPA